MKVEYMYESYQKDKGITKFYKVDNHTVIKNKDGVRIIVKDELDLNPKTIEEIKTAIEANE